MREVAPSIPAAEPADRIASRIFVHGCLIGAIILQRFCVYLGDSPLYFALPIFLGLVGWMLVTGRAAFRPIPSLLLALFSSVALLGVFIAVNYPDYRIQGSSIGSLAVLMSMYAGLTVGPTSAFDRSHTFGIFVLYMRLCSVLGIAQYLIQFVGVKLFSFMLLYPPLKAVLVEPLFNYQPVIAYGSPIMRSNGFFLIEPSTFSQLLMLTLLVDVLVRRDWRFTPLYIVAQLVTFAGTGLLALGVTLPLALLGDVRRNRRILLFVAALGGAAVVAALLAPGHVAAIMSRAGEFQYSGSSGYARYVAPLDTVRAVWGETRTLIGFGPGAMERAIFFTPGSGNALVKLFVDYGVIGLFSFILFLVTTLWRRDIAVISIYGLINFQLGGGFLLFPPFIVILAVLCIWSDSGAPEEDEEAHVMRRPAAPMRPPQARPRLRPSLPTTERTSR